MQHTLHHTLPAHTDAWLQEASAFTTPPRSRTSHPALQPLGYGRSPPGLPREDAAQASFLGIVWALSGIEHRQTPVAT